MGGRAEAAQKALLRVQFADAFTSEERRCTYTGRVAVSERARGATERRASSTCVLESEAANTG